MSLVFWTRAIRRQLFTIDSGMNQGEESASRESASRESRREESEMGMSWSRVWSRDQSYELYGDHVILGAVTHAVYTCKPCAGES